MQSQWECVDGWIAQKAIKNIDVDDFNVKSMGICGRPKRNNIGSYSKLKIGNRYYFNDYRLLYVVESYTM